jgi:hypothetical protein
MPNDIEQRKSEDGTDADLVLYIEIFDTFGPLGKPALRFSKFLSSKPEIEKVIKKSLDGESLTAKVVFRNKKLAVPRLVRLGLVDPNNL